MADLIVTLFPFAALVLAVAVLVLAIRLDRRMSRGAQSAGPRQPERPSPPGQATTPWELKGIEEQLVAMRYGGGRAVPRYDLTATVNRLIAAARLPEATELLSITADEAQLAAAITRIEEQLGLGPLERPSATPSQQATPSTEAKGASR